MSGRAHKENTDQDVSNLSTVRQMDHIRHLLLITISAYHFSRLRHWKPEFVSLLYDMLSEQSS